jgi:WD40 repeat protein
LICTVAWALGGMSALAQEGALPEKPEGYLGILSGEEVTKEQAEKLGWKTPRGLRVLRLHEGGPAANAGIQAEDIIVSLDGKEFENWEALAASIAAIGDKGIGAQVRFGYLRSGKEHTVTVTLGPPPVFRPPPQEPILRIEPGMPMGEVLHVGADAACTLLATASEDATVRLWRVRDGKLLMTLRAPLPDGIHRVRAVAVAPDGSWTAAGGWAASTWSSRGFRFVYVFESATGAIAARLGPLNATITHLAVSPDGRYLAATLAGGEGLRVWERIGPGSANWRGLLQDTDYGGRSVVDAAFDRTGALYTVAFDGKLRRYTLPGGSHRKGYQSKPTTWVATRGGKLPASVSVHPSGDSVAVVDHETRAVEVYSAPALTWRFAADTRQVNALSFRPNLTSVAWSKDGARLYVGGRYEWGKQTIRVWDRAGKGRPQEVQGPLGTTFHLLPCGQDIAVGAYGPTFGLIGPDGKRRFWRDPVQRDARNQLGEKGFSLAVDGRRVRFGLEFGGKSPVLFDLAAEQLTDAPSQLDNLAVADTTSPPFTDWRDPKLAIEVGEEVRSFAIAPDKQRFVLGTSRALRGYDKDREALWAKLAPVSPTWGVNISLDGKLVVAAYGDGTLRWHRLSDGEELLALFVHAKDRRWVAWTPKGYYMASPGAESLIGWHLNRGWDEVAQFYSVDRFRDQFNRPDIVKLVLEVLDENKAIEEANTRANVKRAEEDIRKIAPPIVTIQNPGDNSTFRTPEVTIEYNLFSPTGQKITGVQHLVNNAAARALLAPLTDSGNFTSGRVTLTLPPEDTTITLVAYEDTRASEPVSIRLRWDGAKPGQIALPRLRALFVGVNEYTSPRLTKLSFAAKDAADLAAFFKSQEGKSYSKVEAKALPDAKRLEVLSGLEWLENGSEEGDVSLLFLAGHGMTDEQQHFYYMAADSDPDKARGTAVSRDELLRTIRNLKGTRVVMLDACHSGASADAAIATPSRVDMNRLANEIGDRSLGVLLYASARGRQYSYERAEWGNGAFTRAILDGLAGAADSGKLGYVDTEELSLYVRRRVMVMTNGLQEPVRVKPDAAPEMKIVVLQ